MGKISGLPEDTSPTTDDYTVNLDSGSGTLKKSTWASTISMVGDALWPIGSVYIEATGTNPNSTLGFGTWTAFGAGKVLVGFDSSDSDFGTAGATGGEKTHTLTTSELASHSHSNGTLTATTAGSHTHSMNRDVAYTDSSSRQTYSSGGNQSFGFGDRSLENSAGSHSHDITGSTSTAGSGTAHNNLQPYLVTYFWKRTA